MRKSFVMDFNGQIFQDRYTAGRQLAELLVKFVDEHPVILALPRGGVPVGYEIAKLLHAPLDIITVRKIALPDHPEFGIGAVAEGNVLVFDDTTMRVLGAEEKNINALIDKENTELTRRVKMYRGSAKPYDVKKRIVLLVDDGLATGVSARAAIQAVKKLKPKKILFAAPVCAEDSVENISFLVDEVVCLVRPCFFNAVGMWYMQFDQITDEEVVHLLKKNKKERSRINSQLRMFS